MKRREFCRHITIVGGTVIMAPLLNACQKIAPSAEAEDALSSVRLTQTSVPSATLLPTTAPTGTAVPPSSTPTTEPSNPVQPRSQP